MNIFDTRPAFCLGVIENDILEIDGFEVIITDFISCNIKKIKKGEKVMNKEELKNLIANYEEDLAEAMMNRDVIASEDLNAKIEKEIKETRATIEKRVVAEKESALLDANKTIELMQKIIQKRKCQLEDLEMPEIECPDMGV